MWADLVNSMTMGHTYCTSSPKVDFSWIINSIRCYLRMQGGVLCGKNKCGKHAKDAPSFLPPLPYSLSLNRCPFGDSQGVGMYWKFSEVQQQRLCFTQHFLKPFDQEPHFPFSFLTEHSVATQGTWFWTNWCSGVRTSVREHYALQPPLPVFYQHWTHPFPVGASVPSSVK
jgi:hypothetical protein